MFILYCCAMPELDPLDAAILALVQQNNRLTNVQIAEEVGLSATAVHRRLRRLRAAGVIEADVAVVSPEAVGRGMTAIVEVELEREAPDLIDAFKTRMLSAPEVMQCYYVTGSADFVLIVTSHNLKDYEALTQRLLFANPNVKRFRTSVVMERFKVGLAVPLATASD